MEPVGRPERAAVPWLRRGAEALAVVATGLVPFVALGSLTLLRLVLPRHACWPVTRAWWWALGPLALLAVLHSATGGGRVLLWTVVLLAVAGAVAQLPRRALVTGGLAALAVLAAGLAYERVVATSTFFDPARPDMDVRRWWSTLRGFERLEADAVGARFDRAWALSRGSEEVRVALEARWSPATADGVAAGADPPETTLAVAPARARRDAWQSRPLVVGSEWTALSVVFDAPDVAGVDALRTLVTVQGAGALDLRSLRAEAGDAGAMTPEPLHPRQRLWFGWPNLTGHLLTMMSAMVIAVAPGLPAGLAAAGFGATGLFFTGSRTAVLVFVLAVPLLLLLTAGRRQRPALALLGVLGIAAAALVLQPDDLGRLGVWSLEDRNVLSRSVEMQDAIEAMLAAPWVGVGEGGLPALAHNAWLQVGGEYGLPGALAMAWWGLATMALGWRVGRWRGAVLAGAFLALQLSDESWRYPGVFLPLLLGFTALAADAVGSRRR